MEILAVYDTTGRIIYQGSGDMYEPVGIPSIRVTVPNDKRLVSIDVSKEEHIPVYEDLPKSEFDNIKEQLAAVQIALAEVLGV